MSPKAKTVFAALPAGATPSAPHRPRSHPRPSGPIWVSVLPSTFPLAALAERGDLVAGPVVRSLVALRSCVASLVPTLRRIFRPASPTPGNSTHDVGSDSAISPRAWLDAPPFSALDRTSSVLCLEPPVLPEWGQPRLLDKPCPPGFLLTGPAVGSIQTHAPLIETFSPREYPSGGSPVFIARSVLRCARSTRGPAHARIPLFALALGRIGASSRRTATPSLPQDPSRALGDPLHEIILYSLTEEGKP